MIRFGIIGGGWRTQFYLRIAQALPERFQIGGILLRDEQMTFRHKVRFSIRP